MKITQVSYRRLVSREQYSNEAIGAVAEVEPDECAENALADLQEWVEGQLKARSVDEGARASLADTTWKLDVAERELKNVQGKIEEARAKWEAAKAFLARHGVTLEDPEDGLPF